VEVRTFLYWKNHGWYKTIIFWYQNVIKSQNWYKRLSIKDHRSQGEEGWFFRCGRPHFFVQKTSEFSKFMVCTHGTGGRGVEPVRTFCGLSNAYEQPCRSDVKSALQWSLAMTQVTFYGFLLCIQFCVLYYSSWNDSMYRILGYEIDFVLVSLNVLTFLVYKKIRKM